MSIASFLAFSLAIIFISVFCALFSASLQKHLSHDVVKNLNVFFLFSWISLFLLFFSPPKWRWQIKKQFFFYLLSHTDFIVFYRHVQIWLWCAYQGVVTLFSIKNQNFPGTVSTFLASPFYTLEINQEVLTSSLFPKKVKQ